MKSICRFVDVKVLRKLLDYDTNTGIFTWRPRIVRKNKNRTDVAWNSAFAGKIAGTIGKHGHRYIIVTDAGGGFAAHRLAWAYVYGYTPKTGIDHKNGNPDDNRIDNLRLANQIQNGHNSKLSKNNTSGISGVSWDRKYQKWHAYADVNRKRHYLGLHKNKEDAIKAREEGAKRLFGEFYRPTSPDSEAS